MLCRSVQRVSMAHHRVITAGQHFSLRRNAAAVASRWKHCVRFDQFEIWTSNLPLQRKTRYRSTNSKDGKQRSGRLKPDKSPVEDHRDSDVQIDWYNLCTSRYNACKLIQLYGRHLLIFTSTEIWKKMQSMKQDRIQSPEQTLNTRDQRIHPWKQKV